MYNSHLHLLIKKLSKKELKNLRKWVSSPFFNEKKEVLALLDYILHYKNAPNKALEKQKTFAVLYPNEPYNDKKMRYTMSALVKNIKQYLAYQEMQEDGEQEQIYICRALRKRNQDKIFEKEWNYTEKIQERQTHKSIQYYYNNYLLYREKYEYVSQQIRSGNMFINEMEQHLSNFFLTELLRQGCLALAHHRLSPNTADFTLLEHIVPIIHQNLGLLPSTVAIYYHSFQCLKDHQNEGDFRQLKTLLAHQDFILPLEEQRDIYLSAINFSITQINNGRRNYIQEAFDLYKIGLAKNIFLDNGFLSHFLYKNILVIGLALGEKEWVWQFLQEYLRVLHPKNREHFYRYCLASFYFRTQDYDKAMPLLQQVDFQDTLNNLDARRMLLRIYFELEEIEPLYSLLDSFSTFIRRRKKELGYHWENYANLIRFVKKMLKMSWRDKELQQMLFTEVEKTPRVAEKNWLLKQLQS